MLKIHRRRPDQRLFSTDSIPHVDAAISPKGTGSKRPEVCRIAAVLPGRVPPLMGRLAEVG